MELKRLNSDVISKIRSSFNVSSVAQCVFELVCNSLDAKSKSVAVRINLITFKIQVADNGEGITKENLELLGIRYMTNKCRNLGELEKHLNTYGFRGEALTSIVEMCKGVNISTRCKNSGETYCKTLSNSSLSEVQLIKRRASVGTTVTVLGFLSNFPVRQRRVIQEIELDEVRRYIENLVIINPGISFSLRNDATGLLMLNSPKSSDIIDSFRHLHPDISDAFTLLKVSKNKVSIDALVHKEFILSKKFQYVYVNKRPVLSHKILKHANSSFYKKMQLTTKRTKHPICETKRYPIFVLNIKCPQTYVDVFMGRSKSDVEFKCWDLVLACIEKIIKAFFGLDDKQENKEVKTKNDVRLSCGVSQVLGAVQACAYKRKNVEATAASQGHSKSGNKEASPRNCLASKFVSHKKSKLTETERKKLMKRNCKTLSSFVRDKTTVVSSQNAELSGNYQIEDSGKPDLFLKPRKLKPIIKKPLPIKVGSKTFNLQSKSISNFEEEPVLTSNQPKRFNLPESMVEDEPVFDRQMVPKYQFDQKSVYSRLNADEDQGKGLIMDMFLKSTQVFSGQDGESCSNQSCPNVSGETVEESNFVMENNIKDTVRGVNTTMSISVNVKRKRLKDCSKVSKCVQTSITKDGRNNLTSKCVQTTSQRPTLRRIRSNLSDLTQQFDGFKLSHNGNEDDEKDNYTILINTIRKRREFRFVRKSEEMEVDDICEEQNFRPLKICYCCKNDGKIFNFNEGDKRGALSLNDKNVGVTASKENLFEKHYSPEMTNINKETNTSYYFHKENDESEFKKPQAPAINQPRRTVENTRCDDKIKKNDLYFQSIRKQLGTKTVKIISRPKSPYYYNKAIQRPFKQASNFVNVNLKEIPDCVQSLYQEFQPQHQSTQFRQTRFQEHDRNSAAPQQGEVSSPFFRRNPRQDDVFPKRDEVSVRNCSFKVQNGKNQLQRRLSANFSGLNINLPSRNHYDLPKCPSFDQNCLRASNNRTNPHIGHLQQNYDCYNAPNASALPHCCHQTFCGPLRYPEISHQHFGPPRDNPNELQRQNYCGQTFGPYNGGICYKHQENLKIGPKVKNIHHQSHLIFPEGTEQHKNCNVQRENDLHIVYGVEPKKKHIFLEDGHFHKDERQSAEARNESEQNFDANEAPWYTPNVSNENMYFEINSSHPEELANKEKSFVQTISSEHNARNLDEPVQKIVKEKTKFNFQFSCTPDIFSSETQRNPAVNKKPIEKSAEIGASYNADDFFGAPGKNNPDFFEQALGNHGPQSFNNFFDLASFGMVESKDAVKTTNTVCLSKASSNLEITLLEDQERQDIIEKELVNVGKTNRNRFLTCESEIKAVMPGTHENEFEEKSRIIMDSQNEWIRKHNEDGIGFYVNSRTGMVSSVTPKLDPVAFCFDKRLDFVPKGMSPVLKEHKKVDRSLSQNAKTKLQDFVLESYHNELMVVKWQNFIDDDPKNFFEEIYKDKCKQFQNGIPTIQDSSVKNRFRKDVCFDVKTFETIEVIGQVDKKFIAVFEKSKMLVILFDQHAVHERIRVEQFLKEYKGLKAPCKEKFTFFMPRNDSNLLKKHRAYLSSLGLDVEFFTDGVRVLSIPLCLKEKFNSEGNSKDLSKIINTLIKEIIESLKETRGSISHFPKIIHNVINLKACRGAVKFGDALTKEECVKLLKELAKCDLPFQCAHGRPTLTPVLTLSKSELKDKTKKLDLKKLLPSV